MLTFRHFRNTDPPRLASLWQSRVGPARLWPRVSTDLLEQLVFAKVYFDYAGLVLAFDDDRAVGFAHAGFGPDAARFGPTHNIGVISLLLARPDCAVGEVAAGLLAQCEEYLRDRGAKTIFGGGTPPNCPFYAGLYGGSAPPGVLDDDAVMRGALLAAGYQPVGQTLLVQRELATFEAPIDRRQMGIRRGMTTEAALDAPARNRWEALLWGEFELTRFELIPRGTAMPAATALFRNLEPIGVKGACHGAGLIDLVVDEAYRRRGLAVFLLSEVCRQYARQGMTLVEAMIHQDDAAAQGLLARLGFRPVASGTLFRKQLAD